ncbi:MAG: sugar ABC transporter substrate-binding protein [Lachnospiraceae bacterium]|nr:sugar ABC transporter substrate-binding protein [Lachnospiraceae bacterium]
MKVRTGEKENTATLVKAALFLAALVSLTIASLLYFKMRAVVAGDMEKQEYPHYIRHYAFIADNMENDFWEEVYQGAKERGEETNVYLEWFGSSVAVKYSKKERLQSAIAAKVDGIVLEADGSMEMLELIDEAVENQIPVVTVMADSYGSKRQSFIGIASYNLGMEYGRQIIRISTKETKKVLIILNDDLDDNSKNMILSGINETILNEGNHLTLDIESMNVSDDSTFGLEETIRDIFMDKDNQPDIIVCVDAQGTISACQAVVDYNLVGKVDIIGYHITEAIGNAIQRNVLSSTIVVNSRQMGINSVDSLNEYIETGYVNDYIVMDVDAVTAGNVREYMKDAAK